jgi:hypothetical protein
MAMINKMFGRKTQGAIPPPPPQPPVKAWDAEPTSA